MSFLSVLYRDAYTKIFRQEPRLLFKCLLTMIEHENDFVEGFEEVYVVVAKLLYLVHELYL